MKTIRIFLVGAALVGLVLVFFVYRAALPVKPTSGGVSLSKNCNGFAVDLYGELSKREGNVFFSPLSVAMAGGMVYGGAGGQTERELAAAFGFKLDEAETHRAFGDITARLIRNAQIHGNELDIANALCLTGGEVGGDYKKLLKENYEAEIFGGDLTAINDWAKDKTHGKIDKILDSLSPNSVCVLLNAIYFKGMWEGQFEKEKTTGRPFHLKEKEEIAVPTMHRKGDYRFLAGENYKAIEIPYKGGLMSMAVILPNEIEGLAKLEAAMTHDVLDGCLGRLGKLEAEEVYLYLPKFKFKTDYDLISPLKNLGVKDAFDAGKADFSGMGFGKGGVWIGQARHKAVIEVNEEGTEAAAVTAVEFKTRNASSSLMFRADHPFMLVIRDNQTGCIMFMGRVANPAGE